MKSLYKVFLVGSFSILSIFVFNIGVQAATTIQVSNLLPDWSTQVYSAYYAVDGGAAVSPGVVTLYDGREAGKIKAGFGPYPGDITNWDQGLFGFIPNISINNFSTGVLTYDVENQEGTNPVWMTIEIDTGVVGDRNDNVTYQFVPTSYGQGDGYHTVNAAAGQWQLMDNNGNGTGPMMSLGDIATANDGLNVVRAYLRLGMGDSYHGTGAGTVAWVDNVVIGDTTYDFIVPVTEVTTEAQLRTALADISVSKIKFGADIAITDQVIISRAITIDGQGHKLLATITSGKNSAITIGSNDVTIKNLVEDGTGSTGIHGFNIYKVTGVVLDTVTSSNNNKSGITVNGSTVTVNNITTAGNAWGGINVDLGGGILTPASLTVNGTSSHTESTAIWIDDITKAVTVVDTNSQYSHKDTGNTRVYSLLQAGQTTPDESGNATLTDTDTKVVVTSTTQPLTIEAGDVANATIDFDALVTNGTGSIPQTTINSNVVDVEIPATTITSLDTTWNGILNAPKIITTTVEPVADSGKTATVVSSIEVGYGDTHLTFDDPVKLTFSGLAGKSIGWSQNGTFHTITSVCDSPTAPTLAADSECKIDVGSDLVVWTKHFTTFTTYTQASVAVRQSGGRSSNGVTGLNRALQVANPNSAVGEVLGAEAVSPEIQAQIDVLKAKVISILQQMILILQARMAAL